MPLFSKIKFVITQYGYLEEFIFDLRSKGRYTFSLSEIRNRFHQSNEAIKKAIQRLKRKNEIALVRNEFYVIITPEYKSVGMIPPSLFVGELMMFLNREYYVGLLDAASYYGAKSNKPQSISIITTKPSLRNVEKDNIGVTFYVKKQWSKTDVVMKKVDSGYINISSPELTALDLVNYFYQSRSLTEVVSALYEIRESIDANSLLNISKRYSPVTAVQRLGYIMEEILNMKDLIYPIKGYLKTVNYFPILLWPQKDKSDMVTGNDWRVVQNIKVDTI